MTFSPAPESSARRRALRGALSPEERRAFERVPKELQAGFYVDPETGCMGVDAAPHPYTVDARVIESIREKYVGHVQAGKGRHAEHLLRHRLGLVGLPSATFSFEDRDAYHAFMRRHDATFRDPDVVRVMKVPFDPHADPAFTENVRVDLGLNFIPRSNGANGLGGAELLIDLLFPSTVSGGTNVGGNHAMIAQDGGFAASKYRRQCANALGIDTAGAHTISSTRLGAQTPPGSGASEQWCIYHATQHSAYRAPGDVGEALADLDFDMEVSTDANQTSYAVAARAYDGAAEATAFIPTADSLMQLRQFDDTPGQGQYQKVLLATWRKGTEGVETDGNFGTDASPNAWRALAVLNNDFNEAREATKAEPNTTHLIAVKNLPGSGWAKNSTVKIRPQYGVQVDAT